MELNTISILAVLVFTSIALVSDLKTRTIPKWLTVSAALAGLAWHVYSGGLSGLGTALGGFATGFGILLVLWLIGGGGGGDVKLMGAVGVWLGALPTLIVFIASAWFAILCTVGIILWNRVRSSGNGTEKSDDRAERGSMLKQTVPYALPVAMSVWALLLLHAFDV